MAALLMLPLNQSARIVLPSGPFSASGMLLNDFTRTVLYSAPTVFSRNLEGYARGDRPALPPTGSPVASGPLTAVTIAGDMYGFLGNQEHAYSVSARERFSFLR
jgi:hypothetical protein